jgi:AraC-like DNA-binding protein
MRLLFFIRTMEVQSRGFQQRDDEQIRSVHELIFIRSGSGLLQVRRQSTDVSAGHLLFNPQGRLTTTDRAHPLVITQVLFSEELFSPSVHLDREAFYVLGIIKIHARRRNHIALSRVGAERLSSLTEAMLWEYQHRYRGYSWAIRLKLIELLITLIRDKQFTIAIRGLKPLSNSRIQDAILYLNRDFGNPITVDDVLAACGLSRSHFHRLFKAETGYTFVQYLTRLRCTRAAELLATTNRTVMDIALECGFNNLSHFHHRFKQEFSTSPGDYRQEIQHSAFQPMTV